MLLRRRLYTAIIVAVVTEVTRAFLERVLG